MGIFRKIRDYFSTHFAPAFVVILGLVFYLVLMVQQKYLRSEYFQYLLRQSEEEGNLLIDYVQQDLNEMFQELIRQASCIASDSDILQKTRTVLGADSSTRMKSTLSLVDELKKNINTGTAVAIAIGTEEGLLAQYDRLRTADGRIMWSADNLVPFSEMWQEMIRAQKESEERNLPLAQIYRFPDIHPGEGSLPVMHLVLPLTGGKMSAWNSPYMFISTYSLQLLQNSLNKVNLHQEDYALGFLTDQDGNVVLTSNSRKTSASAVPAESTSARTISRDLNYFGWKLNITIDETSMKQYVDRLFEKAYRIHQLVLALILLGTLLLLYRMLRPVGMLSQAMKQAEHGDYRSQVEVRGRNEIWQVAQEYNRMIEKIQEKNEEVREQHQTALRSIAQQHEAEREALESQINAHFICNTLGCINYEAMEAGDHEVSLLIKKLSNILRYTFDQKHQEVVIAQEIAWVDQYLYLQRMRREDLFDYEISFPDVYEQWPCCKLMFQPFVENSIIHGFERMQNGGMIRISADTDMDEGRLRIVIEDNGCGISGEKKTVIEHILADKGRTPEYHAGTGIGIHNVVTRMSMFYGDRFEVAMETEEGKGTRFIFLLPLPDLTGEEAE